MLLLHYRASRFGEGVEEGGYKVIRQLVEQAESRVESREQRAESQEQRAELTV